MVRQQIAGIQLRQTIRIIGSVSGMPASPESIISALSSPTVAETPHWSPTLARCPVIGVLT
jgi:hypothetical protein